MTKGLTMNTTNSSTADTAANMTGNATGNAAANMAGNAAANMTGNAAANMAANATAYMTTKERILDVALTLFAENGYDGTGVEQIAEKVGVKAPSLYKHFKGKEDILNALIGSAEAHYEASFGSSERIGKLPESKEEFVGDAMGRVTFTVHDPMIRKMRKFLVQEQFRSERLAAITTRHQLDGLQGMYTKIISGMTEKGLFREDDPELLATELVGPVVLLIAKADRQPQYEKEVMESVEKHIRHFCDAYMI